MHVVFKCIIGALVMLAIHIFSKTNNYYIAGLILMIPALSTPTYYFMYQERGASDVRITVLFGMLSLLPFLGFLASLFVCLKRFSIVGSLALSLSVWCAFAIALLVVWNRIK